MKTAKLVAFGNYGTAFSSEEVTTTKRSRSSDFANFTIPWDEDNLIYEIAESELWFKNIVLNPEQKEVVDLLIKEKNDISRIKKFNLPITSKLLLYWPPGTWKTLSAYCIAWELWKKLFVVNLANLISSKLWETSKNLDRIFSRAKNENAILFIDELDAITRTRDSVNEHWEIKRIVNVLLQILDLIWEHTLVIGATNRLDDMDEAILRRFNYKIFYPMPVTEQISLYLDFLQFSYNFKFKTNAIKNDVIKSFEWKSYADIQNKLINLLKLKIFSEKKPTDSLIIDKDDIKRMEINFF